VSGQMYGRNSNSSFIKLKVKLPLCLTKHHATKTYSWPRHLKEVSGQPHGPADLPLGKEPRYPLDRKFCGPQSRSACGGEEKNSQRQPGIKHPNPNCLAARNQSLYRLSYPCSPHRASKALETRCIVFGL